MKIVVLDGYAENPGDLSWDGLKEFGEYHVYDRTSLSDDAEIIQRIGDSDIVITNKTPIRRPVFESCSNIRLISVLATGYNIVDTKYAAVRRIPVTNVPSYGTASVSQYSIALLLELCHHIGHHDRAVHEGRWADSPDFCFWDYPLIELNGKTIGIIGFGRIGQAEGKIAKALGMKVLANDIHETPTGREIGQYVDLETLYAQSDVISLHCYLSADNIGMINNESISKMKDGVLLINNARGQLIVEEDLANALNQGKIGGAALDVVSVEPIDSNNPLLKANNCIITPHISWAPKESRQRIMDQTMQNIRSFLSGEPENVVNL